MTDPEGFLSRWSRRKREATESSSSEADYRESAEQASVRPRETADPEPGLHSNDTTARKDGEPDAAAAQGFELSKLPSIESITAETDIRPFMAPGVPASLRQAALRRAWAADPAIRDFVGLAEYDWDFNAPAIPGFDLSPPGEEVRKLVAEMFGEKPEHESRESEAAPVQPADLPSHEPAMGSLTPSSNHRNVKVAQTKAEAPQPGLGDSATRNANVAAESVNAALQEEDAAQRRQFVPRKRGHGRALPR